MSLGWLVPDIHCSALSANPHEYMALVRALRGVISLLIPPEKLENVDKNQAAQGFNSDWSCSRGWERSRGHGKFPFEWLLFQKVARGVPNDPTCTSPSFVYINFACVVRPTISGADLYLATSAMTLKKKGDACLQTFIDPSARGPSSSL